MYDLEMYEQHTAVALRPVKMMKSNTHLSLTLTHSLLTHSLSLGCKMQMRQVNRLPPPEELPLNPKHLYDHHNTQATVEDEREGGREGGERIEEA